MSYLKQKRGRMIVACFLVSSLVLAAFPGIDLHVSAIFFDAGLKQPWWQSLPRNGVSYFIGVSMAAVVGIYSFNRLFRQDLWRVDGRKVCYLFLVLIVGAGLIVNVGFKDTFGRARPRDIAEFGGTKLFSPAFVVSRECDKNCSFSSGEGAGGFFGLALALALSRKRAVFAAGVGLGVFVSWSRIASGAHFFSDTVVSFFVMLICADVLYLYMVAPAAAVAPGAVTVEPSLERERLRADRFRGPVVP